MNSPGILVIDDETQMRKLLEITLESNDFKVYLSSTAREGLILAASHPPDLILLDLGLPDINGHELLKQFREWYTNPIIILSVQNTEEDIIKALDNGANDYLVKPFRTGELLARIRSALRSSLSEDSQQVIVSGDLQIDLLNRSVRKNNEPIKLTATEYSLLALLVKNERKVLTHHYLLREVWGPGYINQSQYLRVFIAQLRKKIETDANRPKHIITESGVGYRFVLNE
ncbi:MAG: response regulator [Chitinophagaceae bacterium]|nr:response regulator [Chitinophagaceae bacterium]MBL0056117.1 response regulator [Chitinophagaceae bacterium]